ncbi:MAG: cytochrome b N-terminal domain-containing protein [Verrucomicrobiota bacterium]|nr:cytochrome b N-terminal domain-containing protein [Verrucomicrobiota bacterium]
MKQFLDWLDHRTGIRDLVKEALYENIPGGSRWRYVWGSTLMFALAMQFITGIALWMAYTPSTVTAWESVYYIQHEMTGGWFLRGLHHWTAQVMTVLLVLHLMQVVIDGAYKAPREVNFWFGIILLKLVLALSLTGYLLPWDQKGYWATSVATDIMASTPLIGEWLKQIVIGGHDYGHHTLTRFFALHAGVLPAAVIALTAGHIYLFRRHGVKAKEPRRTKDEFFWPEQVFKDAVACLAVLAVVVFFVLRDHGAHLDAPADPSSAYQARPDWYFLSLFQLLKYVPEFVGAFLIPGAVMTLIILMPIIGKWELGHRFNVGLLIVVLIGAGALTFLSLNQDKNDPKYQADTAQAQREAKLVKQLARNQGIPPSGALMLLNNSGPKLFAQHCASCHAYDSHDGMGGPLPAEQTAPDLKGFASRDWLQGFFDPEQFASKKYFGGTIHGEEGEMAGVIEKVADEADLEKVIAALSAEAKLHSQEKIDTRDQDMILEGQDLMAEKPFRCDRCHNYAPGEELSLEDHEDMDGPDLTGYGSREWLLGFLKNPAHPRFYAEGNDRMPAFGKDEKLSSRHIETIVDWLRSK